MNKPVKLPITLVKDTINLEDIESLIDWLKTNPRLTKSTLTIEFEEKWSEWNGSKYSVFVNSGSSANLAIFYGLILSKKLKNNKIVFPCLSWVTTISPAIQLGLQPILCDTDRKTFGLDLNHFEQICKKENPAAVMLVHALGFPNCMDQINSICEKYGVILLEDSCESVGTSINGKKTGTFGLASSFSTYYGHHFSTIEGGFVCTDDYDFYNLIKSIRSHGWSRDLDKTEQTRLKQKYSVDDFRNLYTFYYPGFNIRSTDFQAFIGLNQLKKLDSFCIVRNNNLIIYDKLIKNDFWKIDIKQFEFVSNFAYPIIHPRCNEIVDELNKNNIECRPLIAGSMSRQPFYYEKYGKQNFEFADKIHDYGLYLPNNPDMTLDEIEFICNILNNIIND
jgi:CDP-6-deoxy-D-xylo-4-hexulose-3-dehydrase